MINSFDPMKAKLSNRKPSFLENLSAFIIKKGYSLFFILYKLIFFILFHNKMKANKTIDKI